MIDFLRFVQAVTAHQERAVFAAFRTPSVDRRPSESCWRSGATGRCADRNRLAGRRMTPNVMAALAVAYEFEPRASQSIEQLLGEIGHAAAVGMSTRSRPIATISTAMLLPFQEGSLSSDQVRDHSGQQCAQLFKAARAGVKAFEIAGLRVPDASLRVIRDADHNQLFRHG
jgi:hypothetical protein